MFKKNIFNLIKLYPVELWSVAQVKDYLRVSHDYDDEIIKNLIISAIEAAENFLSLSINKRRIEFICDLQNKKTFHLKFNPVSEILKVTLKKNEDEKNLNEKEYYFDPARSILFLDKSLNGDELSVLYLTGYEDGKVPYSIKQGILLHICEMYDREGDNSTSLTNEIKNLYFPYKKIRI